LGSITHITNSSGSLVQELSYDAWGQLRSCNNQVVYAPGSEPALFLGRGYTGHEHLTQFGLINMNARLYDPAVGRFLSPDPFVQAPDFSQSFNRYSYCLNNPLKYTDESGEFLFGFIAGFWKGLFTGKNVFKSAWEGGVNETKISWGLFKGSPKQILSRFTWELPQTIVGYSYAQFSNYAGQVDRVGYWGGATVTGGNNWGQSGVTIGGFIMGNRTIQADPNNPLFQHEYGHYLQSQSMGWGYLSRVAIPSLMSASMKDGNHRYQPFEQDANRRAFMYFNEHVDGFYQTEAQYRDNRANGIDKGWNFWSNPMDVNIRQRAMFIMTTIILNIKH
jgi:RHS repeat-associated protein